MFPPSRPIQPRRTDRTGSEWDNRKESGTDLVTRLREYPSWPGNALEAADEIERLRAEIKGLRK